MFDLSKQKLDIDCPKCNSKVTVTLNQVQKQQTVKCSRCNESVKLVDKNRSAQRGINDINKAFKDLDKTLRGFGR